MSGIGLGLNNNRASTLTVQALLGHKHVDTTLRYAQLYDSSMAADYMRAVRETEWRFGLAEGTANLPSSDGYRHHQARRSAAASQNHCNSVNANLAGYLIVM